MTELDRSITDLRIGAWWRIGWTVTTFVLVEIVVCGLSAMPILMLWSQLARIVGASVRLQIVVFSGAIVPSYFIFAIMLLIVSPLLTSLAGWRTPVDAEIRIADMNWPLLNWVRYAASNHVVRVLAGTVLRGSPLWTAHLRLAGAKLGKRVYVNSLSINDYNLLEFGDDVVIGAGVHLSGHTVEGGIVKTASVKLGRNTTVGVGSVIEIGVEAGPNCEIGALSLVLKRTQLEAEAVYAGIPAKRIR